MCHEKWNQLVNLIVIDRFLLLIRLVKFVVLLSGKVIDIFAKNNYSIFNYWLFW